MVVLATALASCAGTGANRRVTPSPQEATKLTSGSWIELRLEQKDKIAGELIAVHEDSVFVLRGDEFLELPRDGVMRADVYLYFPNLAAYQSWTLLGTLSTLSNGFYLVFTAPAWLITGTLATASEGRAPRFRYQHGSGGDEAANWQGLRKFARFPQGLSPELDRKGLK